MARSISRFTRADSWLRRVSRPRIKRTRVSDAGAQLVSGAGELSRQFARSRGAITVMGCCPEVSGRAPQERTHRHGNRCRRRHQSGRLRSHWRARLRQGRPLRVHDLRLREGVEHGPARRIRYAAGRRPVRVVVRRLCLLELGRLLEDGRRWRGGRRPGRCERRHDDDAIEVREVRDVNRPRRGDVSAEGAQQDFERLRLGHVVEFERNRAAGQALDVDDLRLTDPRPFRQDLADGCVFRHQRHAAALHRDLHVGGRSGNRTQTRGDAEDCCLHGLHGAEISIRQSISSGSNR